MRRSWLWKTGNSLTLSAGFERPTRVRKISPGQIVAMLARTFGLWTVSLSQVVQVKHTASFFGFLYKTTSDHVEEGEERFVLTLGDDESVWYEIEAVSRPRHLLARMAFPVARMFQHRFVRDSHRRMREAVAQA